MDAMEPLEVTVDGKAVPGLKGYRVESGVFALAGPEKEADALFPGASGKHEKAVSGGYWVMLKPLPPGKHTVRFRGRAKHKELPKELKVEVTYHLTVAPGNR